MDTNRRLAPITDAIVAVADPKGCGYQLAAAFVAVSAFQHLVNWPPIQKGDPWTEAGE